MAACKSTDYVAICDRSIGHFRERFDRTLHDRAIETTAKAILGVDNITQHCTDHCTGLVTTLLIALADGQSSVNLDNSCKSVAFECRLFSICARKKTTVD